VLCDHAGCLERFYRNGRLGVSLVGCLLVILLPGTGWGAVHLNQWATPDSSPLGDFTISVQTACGAAEGSVSAFPGPIDKLIGTSMKVEFALPLSLEQGTYFVQISGTDGSGIPYSSSAGLAPAQPGEEVVAWGTGDCSTPTVMAGGKTANVIFSGRVEAGLCQVNFLIPSGVSGENQLTISTSPNVYTLWVAP
jgi:hypothetical protein